MKGTLVTLYLKEGHVFSGAIIEMSQEKGVLIKTLTGDRVIVPKLSDVIAIKYVLGKKEEPVVDKKVDEDKEIEHKPGDIESLTALRKMKNEEEINQIRTNLLKSTPTEEPVEYGSYISALRAAKDNS